MEQGNQELDELMQEVPLNIPVTSEQSQLVNQTPSVNIPILNQPTSAPILAPPSSKPIFVFTDDQLQDMQRRVAVLKYGQKESWVLAQGHRKPYLGTPVSIPESSEAQVVTSVAEIQPRRITPIPISRAQNQPSNAAVTKSTEEI